MLNCDKGQYCCKMPLTSVKYCTDFYQDTSCDTDRGGNSDAAPARGGNSEAPPARGGNSEAAPARGGSSEAPPARGGNSETRAFDAISI